MANATRMRTRIITNPRAGRGRAAGVARLAQAELQAAGWQAEIVPSSAPGEATSLAREAAASYDLVVACGGDGTLNEVVSGAAGVRPVGFIPCGTGNDFARTMGISLDPRQAARQLLNGTAHPVDLLALESPGGAPVMRYAINVVGVGLDAAVAARMNRQPRLGGGCLSYLWALMIELGRLEPVRLRLEVDGQRWEGAALLVAIANAISYGGGMRIAPQARVDDGLLDVVVVGPMGRIEFLRTLPRVFNGSHLQHPAVSWQCGREVLVECDQPAPVLVDGDVRAQTPLRVKLLPGGVDFWLPDSHVPQIFRLRQ